MADRRGGQKVSSKLEMSKIEIDDKLMVKGTVTGQT
jgi:hypothetical protein